jgi:hypothetical protein
MIHPEEKLYGWGVCGITMPRALDTIHPDKRKTSVKIPSATRRKVASRLWRSSGVSRIFIDDLPWSQAMLLTFLSTVILASVSVINRTFPMQQVGQLSKPVDIIISMFEEEREKNISPIQEKKQLPKADYDDVEQQIMAKMATEKQQQIIISELKEAKQSVNAEKPRNTPIEPLPDSRGKLRTVNKLVKAPRTIASSTLLVETEPEYEKITISPPTSPNYLGKNDDRVLQRIRSDVVTNFEAKTNNKVADRILHTDRLQRKYKSARSKFEKSENNRQMPATDISAFHRLVEPAEVASPDTGQSDHRYAFGGEKGSNHPMQIASLNASPQVSLQLQKQRENSKLEPQRQIKYFSPRSPVQLSVSQQSLPATTLPTLQKQLPVYDSAPLKGRLSDERHTLAGNNRYQSLKHESTNQQFSFQQQNQEEDLSLVPPAPSKSFADEHEALTNSPALLTKTQDFSGEILPDEVDPSKLISLKEFNVCTDPEEEFRLRTQLAVRLDGPFWIQTGRVLLFFKHPESGYTMQIRIYNPYGRIFRDRCELLQLAMHGIVHRTN